MSQGRIGRERAAWERIASRYERVIAGDDRFYRDVAQAMAEAIEPGDALLEIACGTGLMTASAARSAARVVGLDISPNMIAEARRRKKERRLDNAEFYVGDGYNTAHKDGSFDAVLCFRVLNVVEEPVSLLREAHRVLRNGGTLITATDCDAEHTSVRGWMTALVLRALHLLGIVQVVHHLRYDDLIGMIESSSFRIVDQRKLEFNAKKGLYIKAVKV